MDHTAPLTARRIIRSGAAFAAFGALTVVAAAPAHAGVYHYGWAGANVAADWAWSSTTGVTTGDDSDSDGFHVAVADYLTVKAGTSAAVISGMGSTSTTAVEEARLQFTADDFEGLLDDLPESPSPSASESPDASPGASPSESPSPGITEVPTDPSADPGASESPRTELTEVPVDPSGDPSTSESPRTELTEVPVDPSGDPSVSPSGPELTEVSGALRLGGDSAALAGGGDEIVLDVTVSGMSVTTTQTWSGEVTHSFEAGAVTENVDLLDASVSVFEQTGVLEDTTDGVAWTDAYTVGLLTLTVPETAEFTHPLAVAYASVSEELHESGEGDDKQPPPERDEPEPRPEQQPHATPLAQTGSPIGGFVAAGAAIALGGGAAVFLARGRRSAVPAEETAES
ncbi:hypothetical protein [Nocardiopsis sp. LOL_012]|uniref:hypothetical protein n=1 Tax=Nocardiopsis sp. LOL_012 TaxID=3345409 RepID=UPI003A89D0D0